MNTRITSTGFAVAQKILHTSGTIFIVFSTFTGKMPTARKTMKQCPADNARAF